MITTCAQPDTIYVKANPCCTLVQSIEDCEDIGNSLAAIQFNFSNLDSHVCNLELSAKEFWDPTYTLVDSMSANWQNAYSIVQSLSAAWNNAYTTVSQYSAAWIEPISVMYSTPRSYGAAAHDVGNISSGVWKWVVDNFPLTSVAVGENCPTVNYVPGQKLWVYIGNINRLAQVLIAQGTCTCHWFETLLTIWNYTINHGAGYYTNTWWTDRRGNVPYVYSGEGAFMAYARADDVRIRATASTLTSTYYDTYMSSFNCIEYQVIGNQWAYIGYRY